MVAASKDPYLEKGVITRILRIAKANLFSDLNNIKEYPLLDERFSKFYGFTQEEVDELYSLRYQLQLLQKRLKSGITAILLEKR